MPSSAELRVQFTALEQTIRKIGKDAVIKLDPLSLAEALNTDLRLIHLDERTAIFWSAELERPAFLIGEGECSHVDDDGECPIELSFNQFSGDILPVLKESRQAIKLLSDLSTAKELHEYEEALDKYLDLENTYRQSLGEEKDLETYRRLREKYKRG